MEANMRFPGNSVVMNLRASAGDVFNPSVGKVPWRRKWQPNPVFLPGESDRQRRAWWTTVHGVTKEWDISWRLNSSATTYHLIS